MLGQVTDNGCGICFRSLKKITTVKYVMRLSLTAVASVGLPRTGKEIHFKYIEDLCVLG
jgi:hypothetical protein